MKYTGRLSKTIVKKRIGVLAGEEVYRAEAIRITEEMLSKLPYLFHAHDVAEGDWVALSLALAKAHVPGFKVVSPAGRRTEWHITDKAEFKLDVDSHISKSGQSVVEAIKQIIRLEAWAEKTKPMTISALEKHYYTADARCVQLVQDARAFKALPESERVRAERLFINTLKS